MKNLFVLLVSTFVGLAVFAQTPISGIVNTYAEVTNVNTSNNSVTVSSSTGFNAGDKVLIIQMQGASINASQNANFGTITDYKSAGNYEFQTICSMQGNTVIFNHKLLKSYDITGAVQLISVAVYQNAVISGGDLTAQPWNGKTGGVVVLDAETLDFGSQNINVTGLGFRGGIASISGQNCNFLGDFDYYSSIQDPDANAPKGEGIAKAIINKECSRGPQANGGGGGNNHNGGGSGGANYGNGGAGGQRIKESTFLCGSEIGVNSKPLNTGYSSNKIFLGGGGGAGHGNNGGTVGESGLNGGGIVILKTNIIIGNSQNILANGTTSPVNATGDGAGGGGAGGTVLISMNTISSTLNIEANGSDGINTDNNGNSNCSGPGGGAGGGVIWISDASNPTNLNGSILGGDAGIIATTSQSNCTVGSTNGGQPGANGALLFNLALPVGSEIFSSSTLNPNTCDVYVSPSGNYIWDSTGTFYDTILGAGCDSVFVINLTVTVVDTAVTISNATLTSVVSGGTYQWFDCENFTPISAATGQSFTPTSSGIYALQVTLNGCTDTSDCHRVIPVGIIENSFGNALTVFPNPSTGMITIDFGSSTETVEATITTLSGQVVSSKSVSNTSRFSMEIAAAKGLYILRLSTLSGKTAVMKLVKE